MKLKPSDAEHAGELMELQGRLARRFIFSQKPERKSDDVPMTRQEIRVLIALAETDNSRMSDLAARLVCSVSSLTAIMDRLVAKGLAARRPSKTDRRVVLVALTPEGRRRHEQSRRARLRMAQAMLTALSPEERRNFLALMRKIVTATTASAVILALLFSTGCASVRQARAVQNQKPAERPAGERTLTANELGLNGSFILPPSSGFPGLTYKDMGFTDGFVLTIDEAVRLALTNSPSVAQARAALVVAEAQVSEAKAAALPQVNASSGYTRSKTLGNDGGSTPALDGYSFGVSASEDIFSFGRNTAAIRQAQAQRDAAVAQYQAALNTAAYNTRTGFYNLCLAQDLLAISLDAVRDYASHLDQVRVMAEIGTRIRYDITKAEVDLGNAKLSALTASNTLLTARAALGRAIGLAEALPCAIGTTLPKSDLNETLDILFARARQTNPDLIALRAQASAASAAVDYSISDLYPDLSFDFGYSWSGGSFPLSRSWSFGPTLDWSLFSGWRKTSAVTVSAAELQSARAGIAGREQQLYQDLTTAQTLFETARAQAALAEIVVREARENLDLVGERYRLGLATSVELTDAEVAVSQARSQQVQARHDELAAFALIRLNVGD